MSRVKSKAKVIDYEVHSGDTLKLLWHWTEAAANGNYYAVDLTGYSGALQVKTNKTDTTALVSMMASPTSNTGILLGQANNNIKIIIPSSNTANLAVGTYSYDLKMTDIIGYTDTVVEGKIKILQNVTR